MVLTLDLDQIFFIRRAIDLHYFGFSHMVSVYFEDQSNNYKDSNIKNTRWSRDQIYKQFISLR